MSGAPGRPSHVFLVGMMGSGKSAVGQLLAERLGCDYLDNDALLEARAGHTLGEVFAGGADAGHALEREIFVEQRAHPAPAVIGVAGSIVLDPALRAQLAGESVAWLRARPATLARRVSAQDKVRPLLQSGLEQALAALDAERRPYFAEVARIVLDVDDLAPAEIVQRLVTGLALD